jgi:hypothetical protein
VRENCTPGSVRGRSGNWPSYRDGSRTQRHWGLHPWAVGATGAPGQPGPHACSHHTPGTPADALETRSRPVCAAGSRALEAAMAGERLPRRTHGRASTLGVCLSRPHRLRPQALGGGYGQDGPGDHHDGVYAAGAADAGSGAGRAGGREEGCEVWGRCAGNVPPCVCKAGSMVVQGSPRPSSVRIEAGASGGIRTQRSGGNAAGLSMATGYAPCRRHRNHEVFTS